jgi:DNA-binding beta-propeller fold protein YncE
VLKLPAGSNTQVEMPFTGLNGPWGVAVDTTANVYVTDRLNHRVVELLAGSNTQVDAHRLSGTQLVSDCNWQATAWPANCWEWLWIKTYRKRFASRRSKMPCHAVA